MTTTATTYNPHVLCSTEKMAEEEWLKWRTTGIGGSDAGTVLGVNPYKTKRELFYEKTGVQPIKPKDNDSLPLRWGHALICTNLISSYTFANEYRSYVFQHKNS